MDERARENILWKHCEVRCCDKPRGSSGWSCKRHLEEYLCWRRFRGYGCGCCPCCPGIGKIHTKGGNLSIIDWQRCYVLWKLQVHNPAATNSQSQPKEACTMNCHGTSVFHVKIGKQQDQWIPIIPSATQITWFFIHHLFILGSSGSKLLMDIPRSR